MPPMTHFVHRWCRQKWGWWRWWRWRWRWRWHIARAVPHAGGQPREIRIGKRLNFGLIQIHSVHRANDVKILVPALVAIVNFQLCAPIQTPTGKIHTQRSISSTGRHVDGTVISEELLICTITIPQHQ